MQWQDRTLQLERDVPFLRQCLGQPHIVSDGTGNRTPHLPAFADRHIAVSHR
jgi:hypothetical protein